ncbi:MAG: hypothetical protein IJG13_02605 [Kiritimatiellae bacterium]|nr:hypothetical protein [Kiritimatiellia bacterium]
MLLETKGVVAMLVMAALFGAGAAPPAGRIHHFIREGMDVKCANGQGRTADAYWAKERVARCP